MAFAQTSSFKVSPAAVVTSAVLACAIITGVFLLNRPVHQAASTHASADAAQYAQTSLHLSDVTMQATENFMQQQVIEVQGKIANRGNRSLKLVTIYCIFLGIDGKEVYREAVPIVATQGIPMKPSEVRNFRLPFDHMPDGWNQATPGMVIANIVFADN